MSLLIFNCFDGSSKTTHFSIRKYTLIVFCSGFLYWYFSTSIHRVLHCHFFRVLFFFQSYIFSALSKITISALGVSQSIELIFNKQHPLSDKRFIFCTSRISIITSGCNSIKRTTVQIHFDYILEWAEFDRRGITVGQTWWLQVAASLKRLPLWCFLSLQCIKAVSTDPIHKIIERGHRWLARHEDIRRR